MNSDKLVGPPSADCQCLMEAAFALRVNAVAEVVAERRDVLVSLGRPDLVSVGATLVAALDLAFFEPEARAALARWPAKPDDPGVIALIALSACKRALDVVMAGFASTAAAN